MLFALCSCSLLWLTAELDWWRLLPLVHSHRLGIGTRSNAPLRSSCLASIATMDGRSAGPDPPPDPHAVLQQLIRQAEARTSSSPSSSQRNGQDHDDHSNVPSPSSDASSPQAAEEPPPGLLPYEHISAIIASLSADRRELTTLLRQRKLLHTAHQRNTAHQHSLERSLALLAKTRDELKSALGSLDLADIVDAEDQSLEVIRTHRLAEDAASVCPLPPAAVQQIPLLRLQSIERAEFDNALASRMWIDMEDQQIRAAVKASALKAHTIELSTDPNFHGDPLAAAAGLDDDTVFRLAEQIELSAQTAPSRGATAKGLDWATIAGRVDGRTIDEVRTRWNGHLRPGVNNAPWPKEELDQLISIVMPHLSAHLSRNKDSNSGVSTQAQPPHELPVPWQRVTDELRTGRTAYSCFAAFCEALVSRDQPEVEPVEDEESKVLFSLFRGAWRLMTLHSSATPNASASALLPPTASGSDNKAGASSRSASILGKVARHPQYAYRRFRNTIDPAMATGKWLPHEDLLLIEAVRLLGADNWGPVAARVPGRTTHQCRERWVRRLKQLVASADTAATTHAQAGPSTTPAVHAQFDVTQLKDLLATSRKVKWTPEMDHVLLGYVDAAQDYRSRDASTFGRIAQLVGAKVGVALSDKNVRDRLVYFRRQRDSAMQKTDTASEAGSAAAGPAKRAAEGVATEPRDEAEMSSGSRVGAGEARDEMPARTAIMPGSKRQKQV